MAMTSALRRTLGSARDSIQTRARGVWRRDRASLRGIQALKNRILRVAVMAIRGIWAHRLGLQAAALTYYTVFSRGPVGGVALGILTPSGPPPVAPPTARATEITRGN